jgi:hypothetical protein
MSGSQGGPVLQLAAYGAQDLYLTGNPQITNFKAVIKRHTNFAIETVEQFFVGQPEFGRKVYCPLQRVGDLINQIFLRVELPALLNNPGQDGLYASWVNAIGYAMLNCVEIQIGQQIIDRQYGQWMFIWNELVTDESKRDGLDDMVGRHEFFTVTSQNGPLKLYVPLLFWFCHDTGSSLPLIALQHQEVRIWVDMRQFDLLWVSNDREAAAPLIGKKQPTQVSLLVDYIFLDAEERRFFAQSKHMYLIQQLQVTDSSIDISKQVNVIDLPFNHPVKELFWVIQGNNVKQAHEWFNFSGQIVDDEMLRVSSPRDPMTKAVIRFEGIERFDEREAEYFRIVQPYQRHTAVPRAFIYIYSFALRPELLQPTGAANFSRIDRATLHVTTDDQLGDSDINVYAINYNIFRIIGGISGILFRN